MRRKQLVIFTGLACMVLVSGLILSGCEKDKTDNSGTDGTSSDVSPEVDTNAADLTPGEPYLKMKITDYPRSINDRCQDVIFTIEVENLGDTTLRYEDFDNKYYLKIMSDDAISSFDNPTVLGVIDTSKDYYEDAGLLPYTRIISDFGEIQPGETKTITFASINYTIQDRHQYYWINSFSNVSNGSYNYYIQFGKLSDKGEFYASEISNSPTVNISTNLFDQDGAGNYCAYEIITDASIDFYN